METKSLGPWARHKARREVRETGARLDQTLEAWRAIAKAHDHSLESHCRRLEADVGRIQKAQGLGRRSWPRTRPRSNDLLNWTGPSRRKKISSANAIGTSFISASRNPTSATAATLGATQATGSAVRANLQLPDFPSSAAAFRGRNTRRNTARALGNSAPPPGELVKIAVTALLPPVNPLTAALPPSALHGCGRHLAILASGRLTGSR
jgi:hypothetical protein